MGITFVEVSSAASNDSGGALGGFLREADCLVFDADDAVAARRGDTLRSGELVEGSTLRRGLLRPSFSGDLARLFLGRSSVSESVAS